MENDLLDTERSSRLVEHIERLERRGHNVLDALRKAMFAPTDTKTLEIRFPIARAATMVGKSQESIRRYEQDGKLSPPRLNARGQREGYTLEEVNKMRALFKSSPSRKDTDPPIILAVQNFKGGVGKSTLTCHLSQSLALRGYRVAIIDCDSQASTTTLFGFNPDHDIQEEETLLPYFSHGQRKDLRYAVKRTSWPNIDLIPANLDLYNAEYEAAAKMKGNAATLDKLAIGVRELATSYDIVLLDPPPALGMVSLSVIRAANALLIPTPPSTVDFASTAHFLTMLRENAILMDERLGETEYHFIKVIATKLDETKSAQRDIMKMMSKAFESDLLQTPMLASAEIDNASVEMRTVYEIQSATETHKRCRANIERITDQVEFLMQSAWPSYESKLRAAGLALGDRQ